jgi:hypothetical protein
MHYVLFVGKQRHPVSVIFHGIASIPIISEKQADFIGEKSESYHVVSAYS